MAKKIPNADAKNKWNIVDFASASWRVARFA